MKHSSAVKAKLAVLDEIIGLCDEAATDPFKKKDKESAADILEEATEDKGEEKSRLDDMDTDELLAAYEARKDKEED